MVAVGLDNGGSEMTTASPTLLLIHGFLDDATVWNGVVDSLTGYDAVRYDLPGFGTRSGAVTRRAARPWSRSRPRRAGSCRGIDGPVVVVGQSLGTQIAELVAAQQANRVRGLVLLTPVPLAGTQLPDDVVAPFRTLGGDRDAQRAARTQLSPRSTTNSSTG